MTQTLKPTLQIPVPTSCCMGCAGHSFGLKSITYSFEEIPLEAHPNAMVGQQYVTVIFECTSCGRPCSVCVREETDGR